MDKESLHLIVNPKFEIPLIRLEWNLLKLLLKLAFFYVACLLSWLFSNWKQHQDMLELGVQVMALCAVTIGYSGLSTWDQSHIKFQFVMNNSLEKMGIKLGWPNRHRLPKLPELIIYGMVISFLAIPLMGIGATCFLDALRKFSKDIFPSAQTKRKMKMRCDTAVRKDFQRCYILCRQLRILVETGGKGIQPFLQVLGGMGVPLCSFSAFAALKMGEHMNIFIWLGTVLIVLFAVIVCFVLVALGSIPNGNSKLYFEYWKRHLYRKYDKKRLASCMELAFNLGAIRRVRQCTALVIVDNIVNVTVTLLCINVT
ncbi:unnamed protein product [Orchesella dallaii]|uniref:Odorant receptor n=1 Tax=Orchesella dallaii TaxID=48710 RepID=A0ABP1RJY3_9HEXA